MTGLEVAVIVAVALVVCTMTTAGVAVARTAKRLRRPILLRPGDRVPLRWRWSPEPAAILHRRLVTAVGVVRLARPERWPRPVEGGMLARSVAAWRQRRAGEDPGLRPAWVGPVAELEDLAAAVDERVVEAGSQPRLLRQTLLVDLRTEVAVVERVAGRVVTTLQAWDDSVELGSGGPGRVTGFSRAAVERRAARIGEQLDTLDAALAELRRRA